MITLPERRIQIHLLLLLRGSYEYLKGIVDEESVGKGGRCDIQVKWPSLQGSVHPYFARGTRRSGSRHRGARESGHGSHVRNPLTL
jgi:hypothetical protein